MSAAEKVQLMVAGVANSRLASVIALLVVTFLCIAPGLATLPLLDGQESSFVLAAREMMAFADFATIRLQTGNADLTWAARGGYWLAALSSNLTGVETQVWGYRVPSLLAALVTPVFVWWAALALMRPRAALLAGMFMAASGVFGLQARLAMPDMTVLALLIFAAGLLARMWMQPFSPRNTLRGVAFWSILGMAFLVRGPLAPAALLVTAGLLTFGGRSWVKHVRSPAAVIVVTAAVVVWLAVSLTAWFAGAFDYLSDAQLHRLGATSILAGPPGLYALLVPLLMGPAVTYLFVGLPWLGHNLRRPGIAFSLAWVGPAWILAEFWPDKSAHMILPALPPLALLAGMLVDRDAARIRGWISWFYSLGPLVWPPVTAIGLPILFWYLEGTVPLTLVLTLLASALLGPIAWFWLRAGHGAASAMIAIASAMMIYWGFFGAMLPALSGLRVAERVIAAGVDAVSCQPVNYVVTGYPEESVPFVADGRVELAVAATAADFLDADGCRVAVVERGQISAFRQRGEDLGLVILDHARIIGVNLRKMNRVEMHVFTTEARSRK